MHKMKRDRIDSVWCQCLFLLKKSTVTRSILPGCFISKFIALAAKSKLAKCFLARAIWSKAPDSLYPGVKLLLVFGT